LTGGQVDTAVEGLRDKRTISSRGLHLRGIVQGGKGGQRKRPDRTDLDNGEIPLAQRNEKPG